MPPQSVGCGGFKMEPAVRVELTTNGLQIRCSATELRRQTFVPGKNLVGKTNGGLCE